MPRARILLLLFLAGTLTACGQAETRAPAPGTSAVAPPPLDRTALLEDVRYLSSDALEGRRTGTPGNESARRFIARRFADLGLTPLDSGYVHPFEITQRDGSVLRAANVLGLIPGTDPAASTLAVTAHFDHLGMRNGEIYNGADDNASGVGVLLSLATFFSRAPLRHTLLLAALDAEEIGLLGARALLNDAAIDTASIRLNINLDMVGRSDRGEVYVAGTYHTPALVPLLEDIAASAPLTLLLGHDSPALPRAEDWTNQSDHFVFHRARIPFLYVGVENHEDYHGPADDFERLHPDLLYGTAETVRRLLIGLDALPGSDRP